MGRISWLTQNDCTRTGPRANLDNVARVLHLEETLGPKNLWFDEFLETVLMAHSPATEFGEEDLTGLTIRMQSEMLMCGLSRTTVLDAVNMVSRQRPRHIVREWIESLVWDGEERMALAFEDHWGVQPDDTMPEEYVRSVSANFFVGMIARVFKPGCQLDTMPVFEGSQGVGKSSALRVLAGEDWYMAAHESVQSKDFFQSLRGKWLVEIGELDSFSRAEVTRVKTVISTPIDRYRPSYGRLSCDHPRQCVFVGTTNKDDWGNDETGLRRFWPIKCGDINLHTLKEAREQLFAEALDKFRKGASWWRTPEIATKEVQSTRQIQHPWTQPVTDFLVGKTEVTAHQVLSEAVKKDTEKQSMRDQHDVGRILALAGWKRHILRRDGKQRAIWTLPNPNVF